MATFLDRVAGITQITISSSGTAPTQAEVTQFLNEGVKDLTNKVTNLRPDEAYKFAAESGVTGAGGLAVSGKVLSVVRQHDSTSILRPCTQMPPDLRYEASDSNSLHYRSKYNPGWYLLNRYVYIVPTPGDASNNDAKVSHISYATTAHGQSGIADFPDEYEELVSLYAAAQSCLAAASDIQNNMPDKPEIPSVPNFESIDSDVDLPTLPIYNPIQLNIDFTKIVSAMNREDFEAAEKYLSIVEKNLSIYDKKQSQEEKQYNKDLEIFRSELGRLEKNTDREFQIAAGDYRSTIYKYQYDITSFQSLLQETMTKYKWFLENYVYLMNEYNKGITLSISQIKKPRQSPEPKASAQAPRQPREQEE